MWENGTIARVLLSMSEYSPVIIPSGFNMFDSVYAIRVFSFSSFCVSESTAANWINPNKEHKHDNVKKRELVPVPSHILKHPGLARNTLVAQQVGRIVPSNGSNPGLGLPLLPCCNCMKLVAYSNQIA